MQKQKLSARQLKKIRKSEQRAQAVQRLSQSGKEVEESIQFIKETALQQSKKNGRGVVVVDLGSVRPVATYLALSELEAMSQPLQSLNESVRTYNPETQCVVTIGSYQKCVLGQEYIVGTWNQQEENCSTVQPIHRVQSMHQVMTAIMIMWRTWTGQLNSVKIKLT